MADTFKGIITVDGKKRQLPYENVLDKPVPDTTLSVQGAFADAKVVGDKFTEVKAETNSLKEDLGNLNDSLIIKEKSKNILDTKELTEGVVIKADGSLANSDDYITTGYIPCISGKKMVLSKDGIMVTASVIGWYDSSKAFLSRSTFQNFITVPTDASYFRLSETKNVANLSSDMVQMEYGTKATYYTPFYEHTKINIKSVQNVPSSDNFIGHNNLATFNTDVCQIVCYGQSLSVGADSLYVSDDTEDDCYILGDNITRPSDKLTPLQLKTNNQHPIVSAVNCLHSLLKSNDFNNAPKLVCGSYGSGGQSIAQLMASGMQSTIKAEKGYSYDIDTNNNYQLFNDSLVNLRKIAQRNGWSYSCPVIVFLQGERDYYSDESLSTQAGATVHAYACGGDKELYKEYMERLKNRMQSDIMAAYKQKEKPLFCIYQCSGKFVKNHTMSINMAQVEFADENEDVILLPSPYFTPNYDSSHLATNGYRWYGEYIAKAIYQTLVLRSEFIPMQISGVIVDGNNVRVKVCNAELPIIFDNYTVEQASGYGFGIWADGERISPYKIRLYGDEVIIYTNTNLATATTVEISYGGMEVGGTGNIRDSSSFIAKYSYWDDSADKGASGSLTISHIPTDASGNTIVGKKYPMWNWLASWYGVVN